MNAGLPGLLVHVNTLMEELHMGDHSSELIQARRARKAHPDQLIGNELRALLADFLEPRR